MVGSSKFSGRCGLQSSVLILALMVLSPCASAHQGQGGTVTQKSVLTGVRTVDACEIDNPPEMCPGLYAVEYVFRAKHSGYSHSPKPGCESQASVEERNANTALKILISSGRYDANYSGLLRQYLRNSEYIGLLEPRLGYAPFTSPETCIGFSILVPQSADVLGFRFEAAELEAEPAFKRCAYDGDCQIGWSKFHGKPMRIWNDTLQAYHLTFANWKHDRDRLARATLFYRLPDGVEPNPDSWFKD